MAPFSVNPYKPQPSPSTEPAANNVAWIVGSAAFTGLIPVGLSVVAVGLLHYFVGRHEPPESMFALAYLAVMFVGPIVLYFPCALGVLLVAASKRVAGEAALLGVLIPPFAVLVLWGMAAM